MERIRIGNSFTLYYTLSEEDGSPIDFNAAENIVVSLTNNNNMRTYPVQYSLSDGAIVVNVTKSSQTIGVYRIVVDFNYKDYSISRNPIVYQIVANVEQESKDDDCTCSMIERINVSDSRQIDVVYGGGGSTVTYWGDIKGTLSNQKDLKGALDDKADKNEIPDVSGFVVDSEYVHTDNNYTDEDKEKLGGIDLSDYYNKEQTYSQEEADYLLKKKQDTLVSGANIKTINGESILGEGNIVIDGGSGGQGYVTSVNGQSGDVVLTSEDLDAYDKENVNILLEEVSDKIPTNVSQLDNDSGYQTSLEVSESITNAVDQSSESINASLQNEITQRKIEDSLIKDLIPTNVSQLINDSEYQTVDAVNMAIQTHNTSINSHSDIRSHVSEVEAIARGKSRSRVYNTVEELDAWLAIPANINQLQIGDNLYIVETGVPDYWWDGTQKQVLESEKVDLSEYLTIDEAEHTYVKVVAGQRLMTDGEGTKLQGIQTGAQKNVQADLSVTDTLSDSYVKGKELYYTADQVDEKIAETVGAISTILHTLNNP